MEMFHDGTHKLCKFAAEDDVISSMPDNVITNVLNRLPIEDAVKTCVLSKNWMLKWTLLTQLVFGDNFYRYLLGLSNKKYNGRDIGRLLLHIKGPITKFVLYISPDYKVSDHDDFYHWVLFLSRQCCKELTFINRTPSTYELPTQLFSCITLEHLELDNCCFRRLPIFSSCPNLLSLDLRHVRFESCNWVEFVAQCPLLEVLKISYLEPIGEREVNQIAKLVNLKTLYLTLNTSFGISELTLPPKLEELTFQFVNFMFLVEAGAKKVPTTFLCLKTLTLYGVDFNSDLMVSFVLKMICDSLNLQSLTITAKYKDNVPPPTFASSYFACNSMGQLQLRSVMFLSFRGSENEVCLIKSLLACSPLLKKIYIHLDSSSMVGGSDGKFIFASKLLKLYRASPIVEIDFSKL